LLLEFVWELEVLVANKVDGSAGSLPVRLVRFAFGAAWVGRAGEGLTVGGNRRVDDAEVDSQPARRRLVQRFVFDIDGGV